MALVISIIILFVLFDRDFILFLEVRCRGFKRDSFFLYLIIGFIALKPKAVIRLQMFNGMFFLWSCSIEAMLGFQVLQPIIFFSINICFSWPYVVVDKCKKILLSHKANWFNRLHQIFKLIWFLSTLLKLLVIDFCCFNLLATITDKVIWVIIENDLKVT